MQTKTLFTVTLALLFITATTVKLGRAFQNKTETDPISGEWDVSFLAMGSITPATFEFKVAGTEVTGKANSAHTGPGTLKGTWVDGKLSFTIDFKSHESIAVSGGIKNGKLEGEFRTEGFISTWEAKRKGTAANSSTPTSSDKRSPDATDPISGEWDGTLEAQGTQAPITFKLKLEGEQLTGTSASAHLGAGTLSNGKWQDGKLSFTVTSTQATIKLTGALKDNMLTGEFDAGAGMHGKWQAKKR